MLSVSFEPLARNHFPLLGHWLAQPHIARWWADDPTLEGVEEMYADCLDGTEPTEVFIASQAGAPIGLVQRLRIADYPEYVAQLQPLLPVSPKCYSLDYYIGNYAQIGKGVGTHMLASFITKMWAEVSTPNQLLIPVHVENVASWRVLEKLGFTLAATGELEPDNPTDSRYHVIYTLNRPHKA